MSSAIVVGVDLGTGGVRAIAVAADGAIAAQASSGLDAVDTPPLAPGWHEQSPAGWRAATVAAVRGVVAKLAASGRPLECLAAVCVDGTSGTVLPVDLAGRPLRSALLYNDGRAAVEADELNRMAQDAGAGNDVRFDASFALAKIVWLAKREPAVVERTRCFLHQADWIAGQLCERFDASDSSNALKTGYDLVDDCWPAWIDELPGVRERLPDVVAPGTILGGVTAAAAAEFGLPRGLPVVAGATDGTAAALASGMRRPGDINTTLGTTLVFKALSRSRPSSAASGIYSHKLPGGLWLPGAASNTGGEWTQAWFAGADHAALDRAAVGRLPPAQIAYPLVRRGERFPFACPVAEGFIDSPDTPVEDRWAACLTGTAMVERMAYEALDAALGADVSGDVYATGGGAASDVWMQCRADATGRRLLRPACPHSAFGAAVLAASATLFDGLEPAMAAMVRLADTFEPNLGRRVAYDALFERFRQCLTERGYLAIGR